MLAGDVPWPERRCPPGGRLEPSIGERSSCWASIAEPVPVVESPLRICLVQTARGRFQSVSRPCPRSDPLMWRGPAIWAAARFEKGSRTRWNCHSGPHRGRCTGGQEVTSGRATAPTNRSKFSICSQRNPFGRSTRLHEGPNPERAIGVVFTPGIITQVCKI